MLTHEQKAELEQRYILEHRECGWCIIDTKEINPDEPPLAILQWRCAAELCVTALNADLAKQQRANGKARWS